MKEFQARLNKAVGGFAGGEIVVNKSEHTPTAVALTMSTKDSHDASKTRDHIDVFQIHAQSAERKVMSRDPTQPIDAARQVVTSHQWLDCMDKFADHIKPFWQQTLDKFVKMRQERNAPIETVSGVEKDLVVALIDDGVDSCDASFKGQILDGKTFDYLDGRIRPHFVSARGHGTVMANMILRVCPMARIYPIRLKTHRGEDGKVQIDVRSAAAVRAAAPET
jgi:hypothetical protein